MKINQELIIKSNASYLELKLKLTERNGFLTNLKLKNLISQKMILEDHFLYIKVKDSATTIPSIAGLQQLLVLLLDEDIISLMEANELAKQACRIIGTPLPLLIEHDNFFTISEHKTNLTGIVLGKSNQTQEPDNLTPKQKLQIEAWIKPYLETLEQFPVSVGVINECDRIAHAQLTKTKHYFAIIDEFHYIFDQSGDLIDLISDVGDEGIKYIDRLLVNKISQMSASTDIIASAFASGSHMNQIIRLMNWVARPVEKYDDKHAKALAYLLDDKHLSVKYALSEIVNINSSQAKCLMKLYDYGLRGEDLRQGQWPYFQTPHANVLEYLMLNEKLNPATAIAEINELTWSCCQALQSLYSYGLRGAHLRPMLGQFLESHMQALIALVRDHNVPLDVALLEISNIGSHHWYAVALEQLYSQGLRSEHLLKYQSTYKKGNNFTWEHCVALTSLIKTQHLTPSQAISEISYLNDYAASAVGQLYVVGLRGADLRYWKNNAEEFDADHYEALLGAVKNNNENKPIQKLVPGLSVARMSLKR